MRRRASDEYPSRSESIRAEARDGSVGRRDRAFIRDTRLNFTRDEVIELGVRLRGGATRFLSVPPDLPSWQLYATPPKALAQIDALLEHHHDAEVAETLDQRGHRTGHEAVDRTPRKPAQAN